MFQQKAKGQALAEFALILVVVITLVFIILEASRIMWAWVTVQNAARDGARYAITGRDDCIVPGDRLTCVISTTMSTLATLPLDDTANFFDGEENGWVIEVWGVDENGQLLPDYPGAAGQPVIVRAMYRIPIVTPILRPIAESLPVFGQVTLNNEQFNSLGGDSAGVGLPPPIPPLPTPGASPTATPTNTPGATATATETPTITSTPTATRCDTQFEGDLIHGNEYADVTGDGWDNPENDVILYDLNVTGTPGLPLVIATAALGGPFDNHACEGFLRVTVSPALEGGHSILVSNVDGSSDVDIVLTGTPTPSSTPTPTLAPSDTPTNTPTPTPSATPVGPRIEVIPNCGYSPSVSFTVYGFNWPSGATVNLFWVEEGEPPAFQSSATGPEFQQTWDIFNVGDGNHRVQARYGATVKNAPFEVPCPNVTATPPAETATPTPPPSDLTISEPVLLSTPPIVEHEPIDLEFTITNNGSSDVLTQFFTDAYFDPDPGAIYSDSIDIFYSVGYHAISALAAGDSKTITITAPLGFTGGLTGTRTVYGMVDSLQQIDESIETNNISGPLFVEVTPAASPTPSPTPDGASSISGIVRSFIGSWVPQFRAKVWLVNSSSGDVFGPVESMADGRYNYNAVAPGTYELYACIAIDEDMYVGVRTGVSVPPPDMFADIFMLPEPAGCPYPY